MALSNESRHSETIKNLLNETKRTMVMGILNVTPDSFSDGGRFTDQQAIVDQAAKMVADGVDIIDIGGESTRPFSSPVPAAEELNRVLPAIRAIREKFSTPISIDTTKATVAREALKAGADMINDISALRFDPEMIEEAARAQCPLIIMHMQGDPKTMQVRPSYDDVVKECLRFLSERIEWLRSHGITAPIIIDPGIGFGKTLGHNLSLIKHLGDLKNLACPILVGHSRKSFIGTLLGIEQADDRDQASALLATIIAMHGAKIIRSHDVKATVQAVRLADAVANAV